MGKHESVIRVLSENGATLSSGDVGQFACFAAEQNNIDLLQEIIKFGGDVTLPNSSGTTALHTAISEENVEICKFLIDQGADTDRPDAHGWTPRALADHHGNEEIKALLQTNQKSKDQNRHQECKRTPEVQDAPDFKVRSTELPVPSVDPILSSGERSSADNSLRSRKRQCDFQNSLAGIITAGQKQNEGELKLLV